MSSGSPSNDGGGLPPSTTLSPSITKPSSKSPPTNTRSTSTRTARSCTSESSSAVTGAMMPSFEIGSGFMGMSVSAEDVDQWPLPMVEGKHDATFEKREFTTPISEEEEYRQRGREFERRHRVDDQSRPSLLASSRPYTRPTALGLLAQAAASAPGDPPHPTWPYAQRSPTSHRVSPNIAQNATAIGPADFRSALFPLTSQSSVLGTLTRESPTSKNFSFSHTAATTQIQMWPYMGNVPPEGEMNASAQWSWSVRASISVKEAGVIWPRGAWAGSKLQLTRLEVQSQDGSGAEWAPGGVDGLHAEFARRVGITKVGGQPALVPCFGEGPEREYRVEGMECEGTVRAGNDGEEVEVGMSVDVGLTLRRGELERLE
ncbi:hypothetical protein IAT38_000436 [Cryptococcus sp. DSM 104549]